MCAISGVLVMSLPIPIIAGNFEKFHKTQAKKNKLLKRRAATAAAKVREEKVKDSVRWHYYHLLWNSKNSINCLYFHSSIFRSRDFEL